MSDRFVFDGSNVDGADYAVRQVKQSSVPVHMRLTKSTLAMHELAMPQTEIALCGTVAQLCLQAGFYQLVFILG